MEIVKLAGVSARLPVLLHNEPAARTYRTHASATDTLRRIPEQPATTQSTDFDDVLQGEVLARHRFVESQSTHAYLDERAMTQARPILSAGQAAPSLESNAAVGSYLNYAQSPTPKQAIDITI